MKFLPIDINAKKTIESYFNAQRIEASDMLFGNLYIWHFSRNIEYIILNDCLVIKTRYEGQNPFLFFPLGRGDKKAAFTSLREYFLDNNFGFNIHSLESYQKDELENLMPDTFEILPNRDRFDYIYSVSELINLAGRKFHNKKNHFNRFLATYPNFSYERIDSSNALKVLESYKIWFEKIENKTQSVINELVGIEAVLQNFDKLGIKGGFIRIDGEIVAFSLGEQINDNSVVIHIEKANIAYTGIYQAINQQFLENEWSDFEFVNREEDLGIEGLRKAKMTYNPLRFIEKFEARLKNN